MNPIKELFAEIKTYIKKQRHNYAKLFKKDFKTFLKIYVNIIGSLATSAKGYFHHSSISIKYPSK